MASKPIDPLQMLQAASAAPQNSQEQANVLKTLRQTLEQHPGPIPILVSTLIASTVNSGDSLLKRWVIDLFYFGICRSSLTVEQKTQMASSNLQVVHQLLEDRTVSVMKSLIQAMTTVYPLIFRSACNNTNNNRPLWALATSCKERILKFAVSSSTPLGVKLVAIKFLQRVILVQTRGVSDPRLQNRNDPNLSNCPPDHPFIPVKELEEEAQKLLQTVMTLLYSSSNVDLLSAILNSWVNLTKLRPATVQLVIAALKQWTPAAMAGQSARNIRSVEKTIRIILTHLSRVPSNAAYVPLISEILAIQSARMEKAAADEKRRKATLPNGSTPTPPINAKRPAEEDRGDTKRQKLEPSDNAAASNLLASFDFTALPPTLITDLIVTNLEAFSESDLVELVQAFRLKRGLASTPPSVEAASATQPTVSPRQISSSQIEHPASAESVEVPLSIQEETVDPLQMDIDQDEMEYEPDRLNEELSGSQSVATARIIQDVDMTNLSPSEFKVPSPQEIDADNRTALIAGSISRIWGGGDEMHVVAHDTVPGDGPELWMLLLVRMITRVAQPPREISGEVEESANTYVISALEETEEEKKMVMEEEEEEEEEEENPTKQKANEQTDEGRGETDNRQTEATSSSVMLPLNEEQEAAISQKLDDFYERQDQLRQTLCDYIMSDFPSRIRLANTWMNDEWYNDEIRKRDEGHPWRPNYVTWLNQIVSTYQANFDTKDRSFTRFLLDLPIIPFDILEMLRDLCVDIDSIEKMPVGFTTLRGIVIQRPAMRTEALTVLLELTTHSDRKIRGAAINTVKGWVPNSQPMDSLIRDFALQMLRKLQSRVVVKSQTKATETIPEDVQMTNTESGKAAPITTEEMDKSRAATNDPDEDGQITPQEEELTQTPYLPGRIELPAEPTVVLQHLELVFALCVKVPEFLDEIFSAYGQMDITVQQAIQSLITALIRSLGSSHGKLLTLMRTCPPGAESLALRVLTIFTEHGRPSAQLVALVKALISERDLDARFLIPIIAEMDKPDIIRYMPRIVSILNGQSEPKNLVRSVFSSVVTTPPQTFGSVTSNLPRVRQSELLSPAELMVLLHDSEKEIGLNSAKEAIGICFSMTDVYRSEILAVVMQQIMDEPVLPTLFLRTVIQAVRTYKSLVGFVSTTLLSRLITKKIWTNPPLWQGFIVCATAIAPASFGALLQLPKEQLRELVEKEASLKSGLRDYVMKKATNKARVAGFLDIFGSSEQNSATPPIPPGPITVDSVS